MLLMYDFLQFVNYPENWGIIDIEFVWTTALLRDSIAKNRVLMGALFF